MAALPVVWSKVQRVLAVGLAIMLVFAVLLAFLYALPFVLGVAVSRNGTRVRALRCPGASTCIHSMGSEADERSDYTGGRPATGECDADAQSHHRG